MFIHSTFFRQSLRYKIIKLVGSMMLGDPFFRQSNFVVTSRFSLNGINFATRAMGPWNGDTQGAGEDRGSLQGINARLAFDWNQQHLHIFSYDTDSHSLWDSLRWSRGHFKRKRETIESEKKSRLWKSEKQVGNNNKKIIAFPSCWSLFTNG